MALIQDLPAGKLPGTSRAQATPYQSDPQDPLYVTAYGWGGLSIDHAAYLPIRNQTKASQRDKQPSSLTLTAPEIDTTRGGFRSITAYNVEGWLAHDHAAISNSEAIPNVDGMYTIHIDSPGEANNITTSNPFTALLRINVPHSRESILS